MIYTSGSRAKHDISTLGVTGQEVKGQRSRSHEAEDRFGDIAEASFSTRLLEQVFQFRFWLCLCMSVNRITAEVMSRFHWNVSLWLGD